MTMFKNYKCPNGLPPEECKHIPQLINNLSSYFAKRNEAKRAIEITTERKVNVSNANHVDKSRIRTR